MYSSAKKRFIYSYCLRTPVIGIELNLILLRNCNYSLDLVKRRLPAEGEYFDLEYTNNLFRKHKAYIINSKPPPTRQRLGPMCYYADYALKMYASMFWNT